MASTSNEKTPKAKTTRKTKAKPEPQIDFLEEITQQVIEPEPGYIEIKKEKKVTNKNTIKNIYVEVLYKPTDAPLEIRLGATQELSDNLNFDDETNRLYTMIVKKIDDLTG